MDDADYPDTPTIHKWLERTQQLAREAYDRNDPCLVYLIAPVGGGPVKIGLTKQPETRFVTLQNSSPYQLELIACAPGGREIESLLHSMFMRERLHGEWFQPTKQLLRVAEALAGEWIG